jgi:phenylacetate-coenzyme A ligase PaaK-like adenylate-forming protein
MFEYSKYIDDIFGISNSNDFEELALQAFRYQYAENIIYQTYCNFRKKNPGNVTEVTEIPFLPISLFKTEKIVTDKKEAEVIFSSSTTTGNIPSLHYVIDIDVYKKSFIENFKLIYVEPKDWVFLALLPSYLERSGSSLVFMAEELIKLSEDKRSDFFLDQFVELNNLIISLEKEQKKYLLIGVSFALLDFAEKFSPDIKTGVVMETGGMKGRKAEITRNELHTILTNSFNCSSIHSEYGMTELLSQAYSQKNGIFICPPQMKVLVRDPYDPTAVQQFGKGVLNIIDLANINTCCFIETDDSGTVYNDQSFEVS